MGFFRSLFLGFPDPYDMDPSNCDPYKTDSFYPDPLNPMANDIANMTNDIMNGSKINNVPGMNSFGNAYDHYYSELHDDAFCGDLGAQDEMRDEFGNGWENEY